MVRKEKEKASGSGEPDEEEDEQETQYVEAVDVIEELVAALGEWSPIPVTYAGGARSIDDLETVKRLGSGRVDLTIGSALDIFGGDLKWDDVLAWHRAQEASGESEAAGIGAASD